MKGDLFVVKLVIAPAQFARNAKWLGLPLELGHKLEHEIDSEIVTENLP